MIDKQISDRLYVVKALLILCTVYAHISPAKTEYSWIMKQIGTFGVPTFLVLSGYFFNYQKKFTEFWKNKIKKLIIPWMMWGIVTYLLSVIAQRGGASLSGGVKWIAGVGSWYYYMSVMVILELLFYKTNKDWICMVGIVANIASVLIYRYELIDDIEWSRYINIFNWCGFLRLVF